jgi:hypothetical protein
MEKGEEKKKEEKKAVSVKQLRIARMNTRYEGSLGLTNASLTGTKGGSCNVRRAPVIRAY